MSDDLHLDLRVFGKDVLRSLDVMKLNPTVGEENHEVGGIAAIVGDFERHRLKPKPTDFTNDFSRLKVLAVPFFGFVHFPRTLSTKREQSVAQCSHVNPRSIRIQISPTRSSRGEKAFLLIHQLRPLSTS